MSTRKEMNRLADEQSPYLLQHRENPVDWYPWGDEAFEKARREDKPVFLSIGYSTCHWCHVMAHESFEDEAVARRLNDVFVSIKVDREERPDVDQLYMTVCQMITGHGGWPLTILMMPDKAPFFAGTYLPKHSRHGRLGMLDLIDRIEEAWKERRDEVQGSATTLTDLLQRAARHQPSGQRLDPDLRSIAHAQLTRRFDARYGGFGPPPKFPSPHILRFLLRHWKRHDDPATLHMVRTTLDQMRLGGVYDHVGYGFHRYATDERWLLPHFEKMLYDQALLALAYTDAFQATGEARYEQTAREIFTYVLRDLTSPEGAFYSAEDADSEGVEGKFYVWTTDEVRAVLGDEADLVIRVFNLEEEGNFEEEATQQKTGENIFHLRRPLAELAPGLNLTEVELRERVEAARKRLFEHREERVHPGKDDKILTDWNGLMIAALARAAQVFDAPAYAEAAARAAAFVLTTLRTGAGRLLHRYRAGEAGLPASVDDYAFLIWGLLELYEATFDAGHLATALELNEVLVAHFWDEEKGGFFFTPDDGEALLVRQKEAYDGALPSGNSVALMNLLRLSRMTGRTDFDERAGALGAFFSDQVRQAPTAFTAMLSALDFAVGPTHEVVLAGNPEAEDTRALLRTLRAAYRPNKVVLLRPDEEAPAIARLAPFIDAQTSRNGQATAYVCRDFACHQPTTDAEEMMALLGG